MRAIVVAIFALLLAAPAMAQPWEGYYQPTDERRGEFMVLVLDPSGGPGADRYHFLSLEDLLRGVVDLRPRYVAVKAAGAVTEAPPTFTAADFLAGATAAQGVPVPALPDGATAVWLGTAVPAGTAASITVGDRGNVTAIFRPGGTAEIDGRSYDVRVGWMVAPAASGRVFFGGVQ